MRKDLAKITAGVGQPVCPQPGQPNPQQAFCSAETNAMSVVRALQDQELMSQGMDFSLQSWPSSEADWYGEKQRDEEYKHDSGSLHAPGLQIQPFQ